PGADMIAVTRELYGEENDVDDSAEIGIAVPATMGFLGLAFIGCALVISGLPALSGFIGKFALLAAALGPPPAAVSTAAWTFMVVLILAGLAAIVSLTRAGIHAFWASPERAVPRVRLVELAPVIVLLILCGLQRSRCTFRTTTFVVSFARQPGRQITPEVEREVAPALSDRERRPVWAVVVAQPIPFIRTHSPGRRGRPCRRMVAGETRAAENASKAARCHLPPGRFRSERYPALQHRRCAHRARSRSTRMDFRVRR